MADSGHGGALRSRVFDLGWWLHKRGYRLGMKLMWWSV